MSINPKVSFTIPCYNHGGFLGDAIASVEKCPRELCELIIVNDGSTDDGTLRRIEELKSAGYRIIDQENKGVGAARNAGISAAKGKYIIPLDADNKIRPDFVVRAATILDEQADIAMVHGDFQYFGLYDHVAHSAEFDIKMMLNRNYIDACACFRKEMWEAAGGYDENMPVQGVEDWEFWLNSYSKGFKFLYVNMVAFDYASRSDSMLANAKIKENWIRNEEYLYKKYAILLKEHYREYCRWDFHGRELRTKPLRTIFRLVANAFFPRLHRKFYKLSNDAH